MESPVEKVMRLAVEEGRITEAEYNRFLLASAETFPIATHQYLVEFRPYEDAALDKGWGRSKRLYDNEGQPWSRWSAHKFADRMNMSYAGVRVARVLNCPVGDWVEDHAD
jgi:hypothetical protein